MIWNSKMVAEELPLRSDALQVARVEVHVSVSARADFLKRLVGRPYCAALLILNLLLLPNSASTQERLASYSDSLWIGYDYVLRRPDGSTTQLPAGEPGHTEGMRMAAFSPDGRYIAYLYGNRRDGSDLAVQAVDGDSTLVRCWITGFFRTISTLEWIDFSDHLYVLVNVPSDGASHACMKIYSFTNRRWAVDKWGYSFVGYTDTGDAIRVDVRRSFGDRQERKEIELADLLASDVGFIWPDDARRIIEGRMASLLAALRSQEFEEIARLVHPEKGVRVSIDTYMNEDDLVFTREQVRNAPSDTTRLLAGYQDGSGFEVWKTARQLLWVGVPAGEVGYNRIIGTGNTMNNLFEFFPGGIVVEYHSPGTEQREGMDWYSRRFVFEELDGTWYLVGIATDHWTI